MSADDSLLGAAGTTESAEGSGDDGASGAATQAQDTGQQGAADGAQNPDKTQGQQGGDTDDGLLGKDPEGEKKAEGEGEKKDGEDKKDAAEITPESYGDFTTPEGMPVNETVLGEFKTVAAELKLPKDAAQKLVDLQVKNVQAQVQQWKDTREGWVKELKADKDFGGEKFDQTIHKANMALRQFDTDGSFLKALKGTFDNHPATVKMLARVHDALGEDAVHTAREAGKGKDTPLHVRLYKDADMGHGVPKPE
jgi:hypothetical protein